MMLQFNATIVPVAKSHERQRSIMRALVAAGATWAAASAGFADVPSGFQSIMSGIAAVLTAGTVAFGAEKSAPVADLKKFRYCKVNTRLRHFAWAQVLGQNSALKKPVMVGSGL
ncbi:hypothetical protein ACIA3K_27865 [Micromonospora sp. NPDC051543]|uniref:hypothetical protein n=1 Tax=Micromonospora sp. NPDC051543 TaxID=3364287 RepID=UPI0037B6853F